MLKIKVEKGNIERALKKYKSKVIKTRLMTEIKDRKDFEKPSIKNRRIKEKGVYKQKKRDNN
jgi:small subunit ribosomal protein S21|tara:strand:+ start:3141 stop:3326 length:186 start_codon:yes stop_codon:yes gene_type:complete